MVTMELFGIGALRGSRFLSVWAINLCVLLMNYSLGQSPANQANKNKGKKREKKGKNIYIKSSKLLKSKLGQMKGMML